MADAFGNEADAFGNEDLFSAFSAEANQQSETRQNG